jgi:hypothetical protein
MLAVAAALLGMSFLLGYALRGRDTRELLLLDAAKETQSERAVVSILQPPSEDLRESPASAPVEQTPETVPAPPLLLSTNEQIRELRKGSIERCAARFEANPEKDTARWLVQECALAILDASADYLVLPKDGEIDNSATSPKLAPTERSVVQLIGEIQNRKYLLQQFMFPLYFELEKIKPDSLFTGRPDLTPEQVQAVRNQVEIARGILK